MAEEKEKEIQQKGDIAVVLPEERWYDPPQEGRDTAYVKNLKEYRELYNWALDDPDGFWSAKAREFVTWFKLWDKTCYWDFHKPEIRFYEGGKLNVAYNCLDRHVMNPEKRNQAAIIWQGEPDHEWKIYTYQQLHREVCRFANVLKSLGVKKGDRVTIYLPMIPQLPIVALACARIGAIHSIVFGGFSAEALKGRVLDADAKVIITCDGTYRGGRRIPLLPNAMQILDECPSVEHLIVVNRFGDPIDLPDDERYKKYEVLMDDPKISDWCDYEIMDAEDPLFILYTSGTTGKPKGIFHTQGGYLVYVSYTLKWSFDIQPGDVWWCTADIGWITGHSYVMYGPLNLGTTSFMYEGVPTYPNPGRWWQLVERYKITKFYTAPTAIRMLIREGEKWPQSYEMPTLKILGSVGEPINPEAWVWYWKNVGKGRCPISDTWWQTETGGFCIATPPYAAPQKPGFAGLPIAGTEWVVLRGDGTKADVNEGGHLCATRAWPGLARGVWGDPKRFYQTYFERFPGYYLTGDGAYMEEHGYFRILGRLDDVINVSGHRLGTMELESAFVEHPAVAEASVVGMPHDIKGEAIYAYIVLKEGVQPSEELRKELVQWIRKKIGPVATPDVIQFCPDLPKTRSGKIMRRILRKIAAKAYGELGDISTLANPDIVEQIIKGREAIG